MKLIVHFLILPNAVQMLKIDTGSVITGGE